MEICEASLILADEVSTIRFGERLGSALSTGDLVCLEGPLGAGKSCLARAAVRSWASDPALDVPSPTYTIVQVYERHDGASVWHTDLYRISDPSECIELGLDEALSQSAVLVEWPDRLDPSIAAGATAQMWITIEPAEEPDARKLTLRANSGWADRFESLTSDS